MGNKCCVDKKHIISVLTYVTIYIYFKSSVNIHVNPTQIIIFMLPIPSCIIYKSLVEYIDELKELDLYVDAYDVLVKLSNVCLTISAIVSFIFIIVGLYVSPFDLKLKMIGFGCVSFIVLSFLLINTLPEIYVRNYFK